MARAEKPGTTARWLGLWATLALAGPLGCGDDAPSGVAPGIVERQSDILATALFRWRGSNDGVNNSYSFHFTQPFTWRRVYIDADHSALSGFPTAGLGADFLIENATLFRHGAAGWNWNSIGSSGLVAAADAVSFTVSRALLGQTAFPNVNSLAFEGESAGSPFQTTPSYEHVYTPSGPIAGYFAENDAANVYYQANFAANNAFKHVFIDSDASGASGYAFAGIGADFLIENDALYQHIGTGWNWARIADTPATGGATGIKSWTVPRATLGETNASGETANLVFHGSGGTAAESQTPIYHHAYSGGGASAPTCGATPPPLRLTPVITGLSQPVYVTQAPGDNSRWFVVEQRGTIRIWNGASLAATPFLDVTSAVFAGTTEQGLLGLAFHPGYASNGLLYVNYTRPSASPGGQSVIAELRRTSADAASPTIVRALMTLEQPTGFHNGGHLMFGPTDGQLYASFGDGETGGAPAQDDSSRAGKICASTSPRRRPR